MMVPGAFGWDGTCSGTICCSGGGGGRDSGSWTWKTFEREKFIEKSNVVPQKQMEVANQRGHLREEANQHPSHRLGRQIPIRA